MSAAVQIATQAVLPTAPAAAQPGANGSALPQGLRPGQIVLAQVLGAGVDGTTRISIGGQQLDVALPRPAEAGTALRFQVQGQGAEAKLLLLPQQGAVSSGAGQAQILSQTATALIARGLPPGPAREALLQTARAALVTQDSLAPLFATLAAAQGRGAALPDAVATAVTQLLTFRLNADGKPVTAQALRQAVKDSGLFLEARQAAGQPQPAGDMKSALLALRGALTAWLGNGAPAGKPGERPAPPLRGVAPRGQPAGAAPPEGIDGKGLGRMLLEQTEAALSRVRLSQMASLPETHGSREGQGRAAVTEWHFELPLAANGATGMAQFRVSRDGGSGSDAERERRGWRMEVAVDFEATGGIYADVTLRGGLLGVSLLAERGETAEALRSALSELGEALAAQGLGVGRLSCRQGAPERAAPPSGLFMDEAS